ncbi:ExeM/NucH family extracellular endonuclease [Corynebacterium comes]|uniref:Endonuclease/Exonuclease/phosphatase family protein n=1 Tax=Corynebacterium comes TaxID=2675218 RepID=A0A6B8VJF5_9CORY|nr:ExeM/NucH family extracellular endonuclease [Corynebacterium comes]QGU05492.1 Endonuclease/Exonuclease/phosphatase family protein [Corynebacterium comes]
MLRPASGLIAAAATGLSLILVPSTALATPTGDDVVINEVYGGGGNSGSTYTHDFVELYNPTDAPISLEGWTVEYYSATGTTAANTTTLSGTVAPGDFYLIQQAKGSGGTEALPTPDAIGNAAMSGANGKVVFKDAAGNTVDLVGFGSTANLYEGSGPTRTLSNSTSAQREPLGHDTDDNALDFIAAAPTPQSSAGTGPVITDPEPDPGTEPGAAVSIAEIQGTGAVSPYADKQVTTEGVVTAVYPEGGRNGFILQTGGTGGVEKQAGDASDAVFVYMGSQSTYPAIGDSIIVTAQAEERFDVTQLTRPTITAADTTFAPVTPTTIDRLPAGAETREAYEHMLVLPTGAHTVTNNYALNTFGEIGLAPGTTAHRQPTDVHAPDTDPASAAQRLAAEQQDELVLLDDGRTRNYLNSDQATPLPYVAVDGAKGTSIRSGAAVDFQHPVVVDFSHNHWRFQPTTPITGDNSAAQLPITWEDTRAAEIDAMDSVKGDHSIASFNVLNYFTSLGEDETGCRAYTDRNGTPVGANGCDVRGAYTEAAFNDQQTKIVAAINALDVDVLGLEEIENTYALSGDIERRDEALSALVDALNADAGTTRWAYASSPAEVGTDEDKIRVGFIYNPATVKTVGESRIFDDARFTRTARQPLAQEFAAVDGGKSFVAVVNHFKSKGSVADGDIDRGDGQGNNATVRANQSQALLEHLGDQSDWSELPVFILGDINAYSRETAISVLEANGYSNIAAKYDPGHTTYQFGGLLGSLDHALGNAAAMELVADARIWNINADEPIVYEYSRRNYNAVDFHEDNYFRSSDHDPVKVGFNLQATSTPVEPKGSGRPAHSFGKGRPEHAGR